MGESAPSPDQPTPSTIHPSLRERMTNRAATFSEGSRLSPNQHQHHNSLNRRRSSLLSDSSDIRHSLRSSHDNLTRSGHNDMDDISSSHDASVWHSAPLAFAILPAVGGLIFQNGSAHVTDVLLLAFATMFLNWCVRSPWEWYFSAQQIHYIPHDQDWASDMALEGDDEDEDTHDDDRPASASASSASPGASPGPPPPAGPGKSPVPARTKAQEKAARELANNEIMALITCFVGPLIGAYLLHAIRSQLTRPAEGLVSNYNLTIFVMAAELRPVMHMIKLSQARIIHLQRIVRGDPHNRISRSEMEEIAARLKQLETQLAQPGPSTDVEILKTSSLVRQTLQPQLDALNRAVRRYEKRQAAQTIQIEARFGDLEARLKDTLALAAAAARTGQRPGVFTMLSAWVLGLVTYTVEVSWAMATYPLRVIHALLLEVKLWFRKADRQPQKRAKSQSNGYPYPSTPRAQFRSGR